MKKIKNLKLKMKNKMKENKAITLVALVITIIILLILAGVSIAQLTGNGLFEKAKLATNEYNNKSQQEEIELAKSNNIISNYINNSRSEIVPELLWTNANLNQSFANQTIALDLSKYKYIITVTIPSSAEMYDSHCPCNAYVIPVLSSEPTNKYSLGAKDSYCARTYYAIPSGVVFTSNDRTDRIIPRFIYGISSDLGIKLDK